MAEHAEELIRAGARWAPGAWTPARCFLWNQLGAEDQKRLESWVAAEHKLGFEPDGRAKVHKHQLPSQFRRQA